MDRRSILIGAATMAGGSFLPALAQESARLYVGFSAGGATDTFARIFAPGLSAELHRAVVVENLTGASGAMAIRPVERAAPSSSTYMLYPTMTLLGQVLANQEPDLTKVTPITLLYEQYSVVAVNPQVAGFENVHNLKDLVALAKNKPGQINYAILGIGSTGHLTMEWFSDLAGIKMQPVAYKGGAPAVTDVLGGHVPLLVLDSTVVAPHIQAGKLRPIAVNYSERMPGFSEVPTMAEQGFKEVSALPWVVLAGPPNMPAADANAVAEAVRRAYAKPDLIEAMKQQNIVPKTSSPQQAAQLMRSDLAKWKKIIQEKGIKGA
ncbi:MAG: tripartite tricarboxylate transporter substrate binding protein [Desulfovibrionaceae bacterium]|jgi:tripartite-type tricarboxylate transporter receptor subunit TctC|nr:tripartite tricarboxylate transporter substrate binding protein [Desulfovibrionaceae bacterium]